MNYRKVLGETFREIMLARLREMPESCSAHGASHVEITVWVELWPTAQHELGYLPTGRTITFVLQHQYWDLKISPKQTVSVTLGFNVQSRRLHIPIEAICRFVDVTAGVGFAFAPPALTDEMPAMAAPEDHPKVVRLADYRKN